MGKEKQEKVVIIDLVSVNFDRVNNVRREYDVEDLAESLKNEGQQEPIYVHKEVDGSLKCLRGFRRCTALEQLGRDKVKAIILEGMDEQDKLVFTIDQGERRNLSRTEVALAVRKMVRQGFTDEKIQIKLYPLFKASGWSKPIENPSEDVLERVKQILTRCKGAYQNAKRLSNLPEELFDLWARGEEGKLKDGELKLNLSMVKTLESTEALEGQSGVDKAIEGMLKKGQAPKPVKPRALTGKQLEDLGVIFKSKIAKEVIKVALGGGSLELTKLDEEASKAGF